MILAKSLVLAGLAFAAGPALALELGDDHLSVVPRTVDEAARIAAVTAPATDFSAPEPYEARPAGAATVSVRPGATAFAQPSANMTRARQLDFLLGNGLFEKIWVTAPTITRASDGLGPHYSARSCISCHVNDGRGHPPAGPDDNAVSMFLRLAIPADIDDAMAGIAGWIATAPDPVYGGQLQEFATAGLPAEGRMQISYEAFPVALSEGEVATLRRPSFRAADLAYGPLHPATMLSPRVAPQMIGLGLLEAIPAADILALADPDDADGDGISGRPNVVWSPEFGRPMLGRFGLKAGSPTVKHQSAAAFHADIGISTPLAPEPWGDCTGAQPGCRGAVHGDDSAQGGFELGAGGLDAVGFYARNLAVPARGDLDDPEVLDGKRVFYQTGCIACHNPKFVTHRLSDRPEQSFELIWPYTDLLLHDMGEGLADGFSEARATGREWRTPPLWGIGLTQAVTGAQNYLHDGRARTLLEAVLWHGGEAEAARDAVVNMPKADRDALIRFLESL